jgi:hypothetical protein
MTRTEAYNGIYDTDPSAEAHRVFFAFSNEQIDNGMKECGYKEYSEIVHAGHGLYGSREGLRSFLAEYDNRAERVAKECDPQKVYEYEFGNYECDYTGTDEEAIKIVVSLFGKDKARLVERKRSCISIDDLDEDGEEAA